jgi:hypothetical protein
MEYKVIGSNSRLVDEIVNRIGKERIQLNTKVVSIREASGNLRVTSRPGALAVRQNWVKAGWHPPER